MRENMRYRTGSAGFTLIELLVVIAVIGILAGLIYGAVSSSQQRAMRVKTLTFIKSIDTSLSMFVDDFSHTPYNSRTAGSKTNDPEWLRLWLTGLKDDGEPDDTGANAVRGNLNWNGPYLEPDEKMLGDYKHTSTETAGEDKDYDNVMLDAWGNRIYFQFQGAGDTPGGADTDVPIFNIDRWDIWSVGQDEEGSRNMHEFQSGTYKKRRDDYKTREWNGKERNRDNIGNWQ